MPTLAELLALVDSFPWAEHSKDLAEGLAMQARDLVGASGRAVAKQHDVDFDQHDPMLDERMTKYVGDRITQLNETTRDQVKAVIRSALADDTNLTTAELQERVLAAVREKFEGYEAWRALRIARTESAIAYNTGSVLGAAAADFKYVDVYDGTDDPECAEANGAVWTVEYALANPLQHPNCTRNFTAHVDDVEEAPAEKMVGRPQRRLERATARIERARVKSRAFAGTLLGP